MTHNEEPEQPEPNGTSGGAMKKYRIRKAEQGDGEDRFYYVQVGGNGEVMNTSELYTRPEDAERGVSDANPEGGFAFVREYDE